VPAALLALGLIPVVIGSIRVVQLLGGRRASNPTPLRHRTGGGRSCPLRGAQRTTTARLARYGLIAAQCSLGWSIVSAVSVRVGAN
jgi:hypothetical protein